MKTLIIISSFFFCLSVYGQKLFEKSEKSKTSAETIYIPIDLNDCLKQLDSMFADSIKTKIKTLTEDEFSGRYHLGFGMWMRNNWGLWKGSRLSKYFNSIGVYHPDDMTGIIFDSYHRQLTGHEIKLNEQVKYYQDYWEKAKKDDLERKNKEFANYNISDTVIFNYRNGFVSKAQEQKYDNDECNAKGIITNKQDSTLLIKVRLLDGCDKKGIVSYDNKGSQIFNTTTKKLEKPKKRVIKYLKPGQESWFNYSDWETND
jgi:hypothetical protein